MSERPQLAPALGLVRDRVPGPPPRPTPSPADEPRGKKTDEVEQASPQGHENEAKARKSPRSKASTAGTGGKKRTTLSVPRILAIKLRETLQAQRDMTQVQFILNAIEKYETEIPKLLQDERPAHPPGLFPDPATARGSSEERATINFDTTAANLKIIDTLVDRHHADTRSQLVRVVLRAALIEGTAGS